MYSWQRRSSSPVVTPATIWGVMKSSTSLASRQATRICAISWSFFSVIDITSSEALWNRGFLVWRVWIYANSTRIPPARYETASQQGFSGATSGKYSPADPATAAFWGRILDYKLVPPSGLPERLRNQLRGRAE